MHTYKVHSRRASVEAEVETGVVCAVDMALQVPTLPALLVQKYKYWRSCAVDMARQVLHFTWFTSTKVQILTQLLQSYTLQAPLFRKLSDQLCPLYLLS
jgi:hypothetical protein